MMARDLDNEMAKLGNRRRPIKRISTGSIGLDIALGGGYPKGTIIEINGDPRSGKSALALHAAKDVQITSYINASNDFDPKYAERLGVMDKIVVAHRATSLAQYMELAAFFVPLSDVVIVDSVSSVLPAEGLAEGMTALSAAVRACNTTVLMITQKRQGIHGHYSPGSDTVNKHTSTAIHMRSLKGPRVSALVAKSSYTMPGEEVEFDLFSDGIDPYGELFDIAFEQQIILRSGQWFSYKNATLGLGRGNAVAHIESDPLLEEDILSDIMMERG